MKILKVITGNEHGGAAHSTRLLIAGIFSINKEKDFQVICLCKNSFSSELKTKYGSRITIINSDVPPIIANSSCIKRGINSIKLLFWFICCVLKLVIYIAKNKPTIVHTTNNYALFVCCICKFIISFKLISHWRCVGYKDNWLLNILTNKVDQFICISKSVKNSLPVTWQKKSIIIYDGLDIGDIQNSGKKNIGLLRSSLSISNETIVFGTIGSFTSIKCHELLIKSCAYLSSKYPDISYKCILIGSTPNEVSENYLKLLKQEVENYALNDHIIFLGDTEVGVPSSIIIDFDFFVGSTWNSGRGEGFGLIYIEAMAQGLPIIAINVGAATEIITSRVGMLVDDDEIKAHADLIAYFCTNMEMRQRMSEIARDESWKFNITNTVNEVLENYQYNLLCK